MNSQSSTTDPIGLLALQRAMAAAVIQPLTRRDGMRKRTADGRSMTNIAESFIAPNSRLNAFERLEIYNRQYWFRLLGALHEDFPALCAVVGSLRFHQISVEYLTDHPSRSFTLRNLGSLLPAWLEAHPHVAGRRHLLALDIARMEWAFVEAFDSAEQDALTLGQIAALNGDSTLELQPHLQLIPLTFPVDDLVLQLHKRQKHQSSEAGVERPDNIQKPVKLPNLRRRAIWLAAHRVDQSVYYRRLEQEEFQMLSAMRRRLPIAQSIEAGFVNSRLPERSRAGKVKSWFTTWGELGWLCAGDMNSSTPQ